MAKRYCISPVIGSGTLASPYRAAVSDVSPVVSLIPSKVDGTPKYAFAFCLVNTSNLAAVMAVSNVYVLPDYSLDGQMSGMEQVARTGLTQSVAAYDLDGQGLHPDASHTDEEGYRDVLIRLGQQWEPAFNINNFDVQE